MVCEFPSLILVNSMTGISIRSLNSNLSSFCGDCRFSLGLELGVELRNLLSQTEKESDLCAHLHPIFQFDFPAGIHANVF